MKSWLKGGLIGVGVFVLINIYWFTGLANCAVTGFDTSNLNLFCRYFEFFFPARVLLDLLPEGELFVLVAFLINLLVYFIVGAIIGLIVGKIRDKGR